MAIRRNDYNTPDPDCIQIWKRDLRRVRRRLPFVLARATVTEKAYNEAWNWEKTLKEYWDKIQETDRLAKDVFLVIGNFQMFTGKVSDNAGKTNMALEILLCDVQDMLECAYQIHYIISHLIHKIQNLIESNKKGIEGQSKILECLTKLKDKLDMTIEKIQEVFVQVAVTIEASRKFYECMIEESGILKIWTNCMTCYGKQTYQNTMRMLKFVLLVYTPLNPSLNSHWKNVGTNIIIKPKISMKKLLIVLNTG